MTFKVTTLHTCTFILHLSCCNLQLLSFAPSTLNVHAVCVMDLNQNCSSFDLTRFIIQHAVTLLGCPIAGIQSQLNLVVGYFLLDTHTIHMPFTLCFTGFLLNVSYYAINFFSKELLLRFCWGSQSQYSIWLISPS